METKLKPFPANIVIIGAGGVGSYLIPPLLRTIRNHKEPNKSPAVRIFDGDTLEIRNMERQLFDDADIGKYKCVALAKKYEGYYPPIVGVPEFFSGQEDLPPDTLVFVCVDNHPGRVRALQAANVHNARVILIGNGYTDAEAMYYHPAWQGGPLDPTKYYPEITEVITGDPLEPAGCTGHAQVASPQLAIANYMAAGYALHLFWFWTQEKDKMDDAFHGFKPIRHINNFTKCTTKVISEHVSG